MSENAETKGRRYLTEGRLTILRVDRAGVDAECRGAGAVYRVSYANGTWSCTCAARGTCSHLHALQLVAVREVA
jgi:uncharacterized Zn finger protein